MNPIKRTDILIAGAGLSGLAVALMLPEKFKVTLITKDKFDACSTAWAQGGIAAVSSTSDSFEKHFNDTLKNGHGLVNKDVAETIVNEAPNAINWLIEKNIKFTKNHGSINLTLEGGHSERRIFHILDKTGKVIHNKLINEIKTKKNINIISNHQVIDLITTKFLNENTEMWWYELSEVIRDNSALRFEFDKKKFNFSIKNYKQKLLAFKNLKNIFLNLKIDKQNELLEKITNTKKRKDYSEICLNSKEIKILDKHPLITIGSHSHNHLNFKILSYDEIQHEVAKSLEILENFLLSLIVKKFFILSKSYCFF